MRIFHDEGVGLTGFEFWAEFREAFDLRAVAKNRLNTIITTIGVIVAAHEKVVAHRTIDGVTEHSPIALTFTQTLGDSLFPLGIIDRLWMIEFRRPICEDDFPELPI